METVDTSGGNVFEAGLEAAQWRYIRESAYQLVDYQITGESHLHIRIPVCQSAEHQIISVQVEQTRDISLRSWDAGPLPADPLISWCASQEMPLRLVGLVFGDDLKMKLERQTNDFSDAD